MTAEQLLLVAREFCAQHKTTVTNFGALVAAASVSSARIDGIPVHANRQQAAQAMQQILVAYPALNKHNRDFAALSTRVFMETESRLSLR